MSSNPERLRTLGREHRHLQGIVEVVHSLREVTLQRQGAAALSADASDPEMATLARDEEAALAARADALEAQLTTLLLPRDPNDDKNVILEVRSGTGGDEAALFCGELFRLYCRLAEGHRWRVELMSASPGAHGGYREVVALMEGEGVFAHMKFESGVHRVQRVPATETQGRIHTSAVTVAVLPEVAEVEVDIHDKDLKIDVYRSSGPGGQSVNTTDSAVRIRHLPSGLMVTCQDEKSQHKNRAKAMKILRARLADKLAAERDAAQAAERRSMVKTGDRSEKIRTYNFPQDRLTDHRIGLTVHNLPRIMQGELGSVIEALRTHHQKERLSGPEEAGR